MWPKRSFQEIFPNLNIGEAGYDLLERMLKYDPLERIAAKSALNHPYFFDILT